MISRQQWGARSATKIERMTHPVKGFVIHWAASKPLADSAAEWRAHQAHHMNVNRWSDIGYSFGVGTDAQVYDLRGLGVKGGHTLGDDSDGHAYNSRWYGLCFAAGPGHDPTPAMFTAATALMADLIAGGVGPGLLTHRETKNTLCPGDAVQAWVDGIRATPTGNDPDRAAVRSIQEALNKALVGREITVDGLYGPETAWAVRAVVESATATAPLLAALPNLFGQWNQAQKLLNTTLLERPKGAK